MQPDQIQGFHERLNHWVASQGFWFQIRHSLVGGNVAERIFFQVFRVSFRLPLVILIAAIAVWIYLLKRADSRQFTADLREQLASSLHASEFQMRHKREQGHLDIIRLGAEGNSDSFFHMLEIRNLRCQMGLIDGLFGIWDPGTINISSLDINLRAGADDHTDAHTIEEIVFQKTPKLKIETFRVKNANISWGFSAYNKGSILSTGISGQRTQTGWRFNLRGGVFSQNWLRNLMIDEWTVIVEPEQIVFEKALLKQEEGGQLDLSGLTIETGARPVIRGKARLKNLRLEELLPSTVTERIEGSISANLDVYRSTNASEGIILEGPVQVNEPDSIFIRDQVPILKALSVVDYSRNYRRLRMNSGSFSLKTRAGKAELTDIRLGSDENMTLSGQLTVRPPTREEVQKAISAGIFVDGLGSNFSLLVQPGFHQFKAQEEAENLFERIRVEALNREKSRKVNERSAKMYRYEGNLILTLPGDTFEDSENLKSRHPVEPQTGMIPLPIEIDDYLERITQKQANLIYRQGQR